MVPGNTERDESNIQGYDLPSHTKEGVEHGKPGWYNSEADYL